jgi:hypothetical protein
VRRRLLPLGLGGLLLAGCAATDGSDAPSVPGSGDASTVAVPSADTSAGAPGPSPLIAVPAPGRPYDAEDILALMAESRRPGGVPDELETPEIAAAIAERVWTVGGEPWAVAGIGGSCGPQACDLEVAGAPADLAGEDLYLFRIEPASGSVELTGSVLLGLHPDIVTELDRLVRERYDGDLEGFALSTVRWLPPPDDGRFVLAYRSGGEEGSPAIDLLFDATTGEVSEMPSARLRSGRG